MSVGNFPDTTTGLLRRLIKTKRVLPVLTNGEIVEYGRVPLSGAKLRLLLGEDNAGVLEETCALLSDEFEVIATAGSGSDLVVAAQRLKPDVIVTDISMPELNGIEASRQILERGYCKRILVLSVMKNPEIVKSAFEAGITGYVLKENAGEDLIDAIRAAVDGKLFLSSAVRGRQN